MSFEQTDDLNDLSIEYQTLKENEKIELNQKETIQANTLETSTQETTMTSKKEELPLQEQLPEQIQEEEIVQNQVQVQETPSKVEMVKELQVQIPLEDTHQTPLNTTEKRNNNVPLSPLTQAFADSFLLSPSNEKDFASTLQDSKVFSSKSKRRGQSLYGPISSEEKFRVSRRSSIDALTPKRSPSVKLRLIDSSKRSAKAKSLHVFEDLDIFDPEASFRSSQFDSPLKEISNCSPIKKSELLKINTPSTLTKSFRPSKFDQVSFSPLQLDNSPRTPLTNKH